MTGILIILILPLMLVWYILLGSFWVLFTTAKVVGTLTCWVFKRLTDTRK